MHKKTIEKIIEHGTPAQMETMKEVMIDVLDFMCEADYGKYLEYAYELHKIFYKGHIGKELAKCWVKKMDNKDGTTGEHWTYEQTTQVLKDKGFKFDESCWYTVLNMMWSDFFNPRFTTADYIEMAKDWLDDKDVGEDKLLKYYFYIVC